MLSNLIEQVIDLQIRNVTSNTYTRDLNTILILAKHTVFTAPELYREYTNSLSALDDGFDNDSYVYEALNTLFSQEVKPAKAIVGRGVTATAGDYFTAYEQMLMIPQGWLWLISDLRDAEEQIEIAQLGESNKKFYLAATHSADALNSAITTDLGSRVKALGLNNTATWYDDGFDKLQLAGPDNAGSVGATYGTKPNYSEAAILGRCANGTAGTVNFRLKKLIGVTVPTSIDTNNKLTTLNNKNYNFAATLEGQTRSYGSGKVGSGEWIHIRLGITWLEVGMREDLFYTVADTEKLVYENEGAAAIESAIRSRLSRGQKIGIIAKDSPIEVSVPNVLDLTPQQRGTGILPDVTFSARMSGAIQGAIVRGGVYL